VWFRVALLFRFKKVLRFREDKVLFFNSLLCEKTGIAGEKTGIAGEKTGIAGERQLERTATV
jgi:hypothetical protein